MSTGKIIGHPGRQREPLTVRLHTLIRDYPRGIGIFKEFIQNADDAGATKVTFIVDWRTHQAVELPDPSMQSLMGPALIIYNNAEFTQNDFDAIQEIGKGNKLQKMTKTGRFGLGFNVAYNVTDYPSFIAGALNRIQFFDPHENTVPPDSENNLGGCYFTLDELWDACPDILRPFGIAGLKPHQPFDGTAFRLPLRTPELAPKSEICKDAFTANDFGQILQKLSQLGPELLLFLKHVLDLDVYEIQDGQSQLQRILRLSTTNPDEVNQARKPINQFIVDDPLVMLERVRGSSALPASTYKQMIRVQQDGVVNEQTWLINNGLYKDAGNEVDTLMGEMLKHEEKAIPWVGVAYRLSDQTETEGQGSFEGKVYCFLPLPETIQLPVHVNGFFDLASSRQSITAEGDISGDSNLNRAKWNRALVNHCLSKGYANLITALLKELGEIDVERYYQAWPDLSKNLPSPFQDLPVNVYRQLVGRSLLHSCASEKWVSINKLKLLPKLWAELQDPFVAENIPLPTPPLPSHITTGFAKAGINLDSLTITPKYVREMLKKTADTNCPIEQAPHSCLRRKEWIISLLRFCLTDNVGKGEMLKGVPLLILCDGYLHTFGIYQRSHYVMINSSEDEREIFKDYPHCFVDPDFAASSNLGPLPQVRVDAITPGLVIANLTLLVNKVSDGDCLKWEPDGEKIPNSSWLQLVYLYFSKKKLEGFIFNQEQLDTFRSLPLVPDQNQSLWRMGNDWTPLYRTASQDLSLITALSKLSVPIVSGSDSLIEAIGNFRSAYHNQFIWDITPRDLVDVLSAKKKEWGGLYQECDDEVHTSLLDFLSSPDAVRSLTAEKRLEKVASLPIVPLSNDEMVMATEPNIFIPVVDPPPIAGNVRLVNIGPNSRWRDLFKALKIPELDLPNLISRILNCYSDLSPSKMVMALRWIKNNLEKAESQLSENGNGSNGAPVLRKAVSEADLVLCTDGEVRPIVDIYDPEVELVKKVLGDKAYLPDMKVYDRGAKNWLEFFKKLGMVETPRARDLLVYIDELIALSKVEGADTVSAQLVQVFDHIKDNWDVLAREEIYNPQTRTKVTLQIALYSRAWLPALRDPDAAKGFPGFHSPDNRLYKASELQVRRNAHLICSHRPILASTQEPTGPVREAIGLIANPVLNDVFIHFETLLSLWEAPDHSEIRLQEFETSLRAIYFYFGNPPKEVQGVDFITRVRSHYFEKSCIWDFRDETQEGKRFWKPKHVFRDRVLHLRPFRAQIIGPMREEAGFIALGRKDRPELEDYLELLEDLYTFFEGRELPESAQKTILYAYTQIINEEDYEDSVDDELPILTEAGYLVRASDVYVFDAPWYKDWVRQDQINIVDKRVPAQLVKTLEVEGLSTGMEETVIGDPIPSDDPDPQKLCLCWEKLIQSNQFKRGLERLIEHFGRFVHLGDIDWLDTVHVLAVTQIQTQLILRKDKVEVGIGEKDSYYDYKNNIIFLLATDDRLMESALAQEINKQLAESSLSELDKLIIILSKSPEQIEATLTKMRIRQKEASEELIFDDAEEQPRDEEDERSADEVSDQEEITDPDAQEKSDDAADQQQTGTPDNRNKTTENDGKQSHPSFPKGRGVSRSYRPKKTTGTQGAAKPASTGDEEDQQPNDYRATTEQDVEGEATENESQSQQPLGDTEEGSSSDGNDEPVTEEDETWHQEPDRERLPNKKSGHKARRRTASSKTHLTITRVFSRQHNEGKRTDDPYNDELPHNKVVGDAAEERAVEYERDVEKFIPERKPHNNPGFDVKSVSPDLLVVRYIEVKGLSGPWTIDGVPISPTQFVFGQQHEAKPGEEFWLYVVEYATDDDRYVIHRLKSPISEVDQFRFDSGWKELAKSYQPTLQPEVGLFVRIVDETGEREGKIIDVVGAGTTKIIQVLFSDGGDIRLPYRPSKMTLRKDG